MNELVFVTNGKLCTNSLLVAHKFGKQHKNVVRAINNLECSKEFTRLNFELSEYEDSTGRKLPAYIITRDGFTFLAMGFTGSVAAKFKEDYITAFNQMEAELKSDRRQLIPSDDICLAHLRTINSFGYKLIKQLEAPLTREQRMHVFTRFINIAGFEFAGMQAELDQYYQDPAALDYYLNNQYNPFTEGRAAL